MEAFQDDSPFLTVACPPGSVLLGGGAARGGSTDVLASYPALNAVEGATLGTRPADGQVANGWSVLFRNGNPNNSVFAVCSP